MQTGYMVSPEPSRKRPRIEEKELVDHPTLYFDDGNLIISCGSTLFRVHRSVLSKHSPTFRDMFQQQDDTKPELLRGCLHVPAHDDREEMEALLGVIYDGCHLDFPQFTVDTFPELANLLRMAAKYRLARVRADILARIQAEWPLTLAQHDAKTDAFRAAQAQAHAAGGAVADADSLVHPASVIALLRQSGCGTPALLAPLFYALSCGTWQFGGAAVGHHLAPLGHADVERFVVGLERLRCTHVACATQCPAMPLPAGEPHVTTCSAGIRKYWGDMGMALLKRNSTQQARRPIEDWRDAIVSTRCDAQLPAYHICALCSAVLVDKMEATRQSLWLQLSTWFEL
ncbi:hypothetical protein B0H21DRAFT_709404 [Amylocystis lapponica]|nr:hypothetical protein B0H21DRAFT_709404 [Amylocystis lapponica]